MTTKRYHYLYIVFDIWGNYYIGRRSCNLDPSMDKYMGSCKDKTFCPTIKKVVAFCSTYEELKKRERSLIMIHISHPKNKNGMVPPENDIFGSFKWATNKLKNIQIRDGILPTGFEWGRTNPFGESHRTKGTKQWVKDGQVKRSKECPGEGWVQGSYYNGAKNMNPKATSGFFWITNGVESKFVPPGTEIPSKWEKGRTIK